MQVLKEDIRGRILTVARQQFEREGYSKTSMREIAELSSVGVGNIYNYFTNKDELFREVVRPVLCALEAMLQEHHGIRGEDIMMMRSEKYLKSCIDEYVLLIDKHRALMGILLFRAQGSSLERFRENYTDRSTEVVKAWFAAMQQKHPEINTAVSDFIIHLHTVWMFTMFEELLMHSVPGRRWKLSCTITYCLKFKVGGLLSKYEIQATHIQTISRVRTAGREEIFTEVSSFFYEQI